MVVLELETKDEMEGLMQSNDRKSQFLKISVRCFGRIVLFLPTFGLVSCILLSLLRDFESSTATHCRVPNFLPSVSAAIGGFTPQRYIWRISIALHCTPRFFYTALYYDFYVKQTIQAYRSLYLTLAKLTALLNVIEVICLVLLTLVSSTENYDVHEGSFISFMVFSELHMLCTIILFSAFKTSQPSISKARGTLRLKVLFFAVNLLSFAFAIYFFFRHNSYCEPGMYTWFAACEYLVCLSNIAFHGTATIDFGDRYFTVATDSSLAMLKTKPS